MILRQRRYDLTLRHTFRISRGARDIEPIVLVEIEHDGITGYGEAAPSSRYGETAETVSAFLNGNPIGDFQDPFHLEDILAAVDAHRPGNSAAKAAIDIALHDWVGKKLGIPLHAYWGVDPGKMPVTSFTIGIDTPQVIEQKVREAEEYPILKVKVGTDDDESIIRAIRRVTDKTIRVDVNEGWHSKETALERIRWLEQEGAEFVEQPLPSKDMDGMRWLRERSPLPLIADESCIRARDIPPLQDAFHGINIKLMKCTGVREAFAMIRTARACGLTVMMGCMIESSVAISAGAHLAPLLDYADLDGNLLVTNDPFEGPVVRDGRFLLPDRPGLGVIPR